MEYRLTEYRPSRCGGRRGGEARPRRAGNDFQVTSRVVLHTWPLVQNGAFGSGCKSLNAISSAENATYTWIEL